MIPARNDDYVGEGLGFLTSQYAPPNAPQLAALLTSYLNQAQELEGVLWDVWTFRQLRNLEEYSLPETNALMDVVGELVGQPRLGLSDHQYVSIIYLRIAVNRTIGAVPNWSTFARILLETSGGPAQYYEAIFPPGASPPVRASAGFRLCVYDMGLDPVIVAQVLAQACPHGVLGELIWSTWPDGGDFTWSSRYGTTGQKGWGSRYGGGTPLTSSLGTPTSLAGTSLVLGVPPTYPFVDAPGGLLVAGSSLTLPLLQEVT